MQHENKILNNFSKLGLKTRQSPPVIASKNATISIQDGLVRVRIASTMINMKLFISTIAVTGPIGPLANASVMNAYPIVSKKLPKKPIKNRVLSKACTLRQYQDKPRINTQKVLQLWVP